MKTLLALTVLFEAATALGLLASPPFFANLVFAAPLDAPAAQVLGRVTGAALLALAAACWFAREDTASPVARGVVLAMLIYNVAATAALAYAGAALHLVGPLLWPAVVAHVALGAWCVASVRRRRAPLPGVS